jgi:uncharacterized protein (TIGR00255 family)
MHSMTGFGRGQSSDDGYTVTVEIRSVNNRYLETSARLPRPLAVFESHVGELVQKRLSRGKVNVTVSLETAAGGAVHKIAPDLALAEAYRDAIDELRSHLGIVEEVSLGQLLRIGDIITAKQTEIEDESAGKLLSEAVDGALTELQSMRQQEGAKLEADFRERLRILVDLLASAEERAPDRVQEAKQRLEERIAKLLSNDTVDEQRIALEVAVIADRYDITEEIVRFKSHLEQFESIMSEPQSGRRLNFLLQELNREANTIGSKSNDATVAHIVVEMKEEIERLREQVQNIE